MAIKIYADTSKIDEIFNIYENNKLVSGFTTNPSLMRKAGVTDYIGLVKEVTSKIKDLPISFEIFADEPDEMEYQIQKIAEYGDNIFVKVPVMNTYGYYTFNLIDRMSQKGIKMNVTAIFTASDAKEVIDHLDPNVPSIVSIFAGRIADTGIHPAREIHPVISYKASHQYNKCDILWASVREIYNIHEADALDCDIVTVVPEMIRKYISSKGKDLHQFSQETVQMFFDDATSAGYTL